MRASAGSAPYKGAASTIPIEPLLLLLLLLFITFLLGIYNCITKTNHTSRVYNTTAILWLQFGLNVLFFKDKRFVLYISTFGLLLSAPRTAVFCSSLMSYFTGLLFRHFLYDSDVLPIGPVITVSLLF